MLNLTIHIQVGSWSVYICFFNINVSSFTLLVLLATFLKFCPWNFRTLNVCYNLCSCNFFLINNLILYLWELLLETLTYTHVLKRVSQSLSFVLTHLSFFSVPYESPPMAASLFWFAEMIEGEPSPGQSVSKHTACIAYVCSTRLFVML